jgi:hypothetical protein
MLKREDLFRLSCDDQERIIAKHIPEVAIGHISRFPTRAERQFAFRCFWVPYEMIGVCESAFLAPKGKVWNVWRFALLVAHSRMLKEMCAWEQDPRLGWWEESRAGRACQWWMRRYDAHLRAIDNSYRYWVRRRCPDCCHDKPELAAASRYGFIQRVDVEGLPRECVGEILSKMKEREQSGSRESEFFHRNAIGKLEPRWDFPDIDLWLIEGWPFVDQYGWTYRDVYDLVLAKFGSDPALVESCVFTSATTLKERCELLGLRLSALAQDRHGRPKKCNNATGLARFGGEIYQQFIRRVPAPAPEVKSRGPEAFEALAALAANLEPFTRLLSGQSKEICDFACPNASGSPGLKTGDKKDGVAPPFFVSPSQ